MSSHRSKSTRTTTSSQILRDGLAWSCTRPDDETMSVGSACSDDSFVRLTPASTESVSSSETFTDPYLQARRRRRRQCNEEENRPPLKEKSMSYAESSYDVYSGSTSTRKTANRSVALPLNSISVELASKQRVNNNREDDEFSEVSECTLHKRRVAANALKERTHWTNIVTRRARAHGTDNVRTAEAIMNLANANMKCKEYPEALTMYKAALQIFRSVHGEFHLSVAKCLDKVGLSVARGGARQHDLQFALDFIRKAFTIRYKLLGPRHIDTVDSLNNMAGLYLRLSWYRQSRQAYYEVWVVRQVTFGQYHPGVAVTAHALGGVHVRLSEVEEACVYYNQARNIYLRLKLSDGNPDVKRLLRDLARAERVMVSTNVGYRY